MYSFEAELHKRVEISSRCIYMSPLVNKLLVLTPSTQRPTADNVLDEIITMRLSNSHINAQLKIDKEILDQKFAAKPKSAESYLR